MYLIFVKLFIFVNDFCFVNYIEYDWVNGSDVDVVLR